METRKLRKLIQLFHEHPILTSNEIGQSLQVSERTIRSYMKELQALLKEQGAQISAKPGSGYELHIEDESVYHNFYVKLNSLSVLPETSEDRIQYILEYLLMNKDETINAEEMADKLYVSKATVHSDMKTVKERLLQYGLNLEYVNKQGYRIDGSEFAYRLCIANHTNIISQEEHELFFIREVLTEIFQEHHYHMSDYSFENLITHIYIAMDRIRHGCYICEFPAADVHKPERMNMAEQIALRLEAKYEAELPKAEIKYIAIHLASKEIVDENMVIDDQTFQLSEQMIQIVKDNYKVDFTSDIKLKMVLAMHLIPLAMRIKYEMTMQNPMLEQIQKTYALAYAMAKTACGILECRYKREIKEDEVGYFALHFNLALERKKKADRKLNVLIVCSTGRGSAELMSYNFRKQFSDYVDVIETCEASLLNQQNLSRFDYVISTVKINRKIDIPILQVSCFLEHSDIQTLHKIFDRKLPHSMERFFSSQLFFPHLQAATRDDALKELIQLTNQVAALPEEYYDYVNIREQNGTTEFGNLVAIPHPCEILTEQTFVSIGILEKPIIWNYKKVQFVFMLSLGKDHADLKEFYAAVSQFLINKKYVLDVIRNKDFNYLMYLLRKILEQTEEE